MVKRIDDKKVELDYSKAVRPDFFIENPVKFTGGDLPWQWEEDGMIATRSAAWSAPGCHDGCGVIVYTDKKTGKFIRVEGDEDNPYYQGRLCVRCIDLAEVINLPDRLLYPMKRNPKDRGKADKWERITWEEAYDIINTTYGKIKEESGGHSILFCAGTGRNTPTILARLGYAFGSINYCYFLSGESCYMPRVCASNTIMGCYTCPDHSQYFIDRYDNPDWKPSKNIFIWGNNPLVANADGNLGHWIIDCMKRGSELVVVDPRLTWLASKAALWLQIRPGTDAALALAMGKIIIEENLYDHEFVENWCYGFEEYYEVCKEYDLDRASEITWLAKEDIVEAAHRMAEKPTSVQWGLALDMALECITNSQSVVNLWSITGQIDIPGGMLTVHPPFNNEVWLTPDPREAFDEKNLEQRIGTDYPMIANSGMVHAQPNMTIDQMLTGRPTKIRGCFIMSTNPLACTSLQPDKRIEIGFKNCDFNVVVDYCMTPTAQAVGDLILPLCFYPERDGLRSIWYYIQTTNRACEPLGESKDDYTIAWELGHKWNPEIFPGDTVEEFFDSILKESNLSFAQTREENWVYPEYHYEKFRKGEQRVDSQIGFMTTTGRVELYSTLLKSWEQSPLPTFEEPPASPYSTPELAKEYPFILTTGARHYSYFHSEHRQIPRLRAMHPDPTFEINPEAARAIDVKEGDWCWLESPTGRAQYKAVVTPIIDPRVIECDHAWWFPERDPEDKGSGCFDTYKSNINVALPDICGKSGYGCVAKSYLCKVYKVEKGDE
jgi:anaerobic selenocysteine-containing dehydrogenase